MIASDRSSPVKAQDVGAGAVDSRVGVGEITVQDTREHRHVQTIKALVCQSIQTHSQGVIIIQVKPLVLINLPAAGSTNTLQERGIRLYATILGARLSRTQANT